MDCPPPPAAPSDEPALAEVLFDPPQAARQTTETSPIEHQTTLRMPSCSQPSYQPAPLVFPAIPALSGPDRG